MEIRNSIPASKVHILNNTVGMIYWRCAQEMGIDDAIQMSVWRILIVVELQMTLNSLEEIWKYGKILFRRRIEFFKLPFNKGGPLI